MMGRHLGLVPVAALCLGSCVDASVHEAGTSQGAAPDGQVGAGAATASAGATALPATGVGGHGATGSSGGSPPSAPWFGDPSRPPASGASWIYLVGRQLFVGKRLPDGSFEAPAPYRMKCVGWSPTGIGQRNTAGYTLLYTEHAARDAPLIAGLSANTLKTYSTLEPNEQGRTILDRLYERGVMVVMNVMPSKWDASSGAYLKSVEYFRGHPAILMWQLGNELNYNKLYGAASLAEAVALVAEAVAQVHATDPDHPVSVSWGNAPAKADLSHLGAVDIWSLNLYPHLAMSARLTSWLSLSDKPMFVGEYGADAYNSKLGAEDQPSQSMATLDLTQQIHAHASASDPGAPALGGCVFNLTDEWWKGSGSDTAHDTGGFDNSGVYPDGVANEEWWGLLSVEREPRQAYIELARLFEGL
jgi:hypothetical protein